MALGMKTAYITLTVLESMPFTCWVLPQGKALNIFTSCDLKLDASFTKYIVGTNAD